MSNKQGKETEFETLSLDGLFKKPDFLSDPIEDVERYIDEELTFLGKEQRLKLIETVKKEREKMSASQDQTT